MTLNHIMREAWRVVVADRILRWIKLVPSKIPEWLRLDPPSNTNVPESAREAFYGWWHSQETTLGTGSFSLAGLILSPLLAAVFDAQARVGWLHVVLFVLGSLLAAAAGVIWHARAARVRAQFVQFNPPNPENGVDGDAEP